MFILKVLYGVLSMCHYKTFSHCLGASQAFIEKRPESVRKFLACLERGYVKATHNPEVAVLFVKEYMPDVSDDLLIRSQEHLASILLDKSGHWGYIVSERWDRMADCLIGTGY